MVPLTPQQIEWIAEMTGVDSETIIANAEALARHMDVHGSMNEATEFSGDPVEVDDGMPDPDLNEHGRIPELDQGPEPVQRDVRMNDIKYTQMDVSPQTTDGTPLEDISHAMAREGFDPNASRLQMVAGDDGQTMTSLDHRRAVAADAGGLDDVPADVHAADEPLSEEDQGRFKLRRNFEDPETGQTYKKGTVPENWGEAAKFRAANQQDVEAIAARKAGQPFQPDEEFEFPAGGSKRPPWIRTKRSDKASPEPEEVKPSLEERADAEMKKFQAEKPDAKAVTDEFDTAEAAREADLTGEQAEPTTAADPEAPVRAQRPQSTPESPVEAPVVEPEPVASQPVAPQPIAPEPVAPEPVAPEPIAPEPVAPKSAAPTPKAPSTPTEPTGGEAEAAAGAESGLGSAVKGGLLGAGIAGGIQLAQDWDKVKSGKMSVGDAAMDVGGKAAEVGGLTLGGTAVADAVVGGSGAEAAAVTAGADALAGAAGGEAGAAAGVATSVASVASKGGVIGGVVAGGLALIDDVGKVRSGEMTAGTATVDVAAKTAVGVGAGLAGAAAGAEIGAIVGTAIPIPVVGTAVGFVAGAVVGGAVGYVGSKIMDTEIGREVIHGAGKAVDAAIDGVETAGKFVAKEAEAAVDKVESVVSDAGHAVAEGASKAVDAVENAASSAWDKVTSIF